MKLNKLEQDEARKIAELVGHLAKTALLEEVYTTPKPGLVDLYSNGAHKDMTYRTFEQSAAVLEPYFIEMAECSWKLAEHPNYVFSAIRQVGVEAEAAMYQATKGVNTHKGLIFSLGILSAATMICLRRYGSVALINLIEMTQELVRETLVKELSGILHKEEASSNGERLYRQSGMMGIRGEVIFGFPSVLQYGLPVLAYGLEAGHDFNLIKLQILMNLMSHVDDSNVVSRHDLQTLEEVKGYAKLFLRQGGAYQEQARFKLEQLDALFILRNMSSGGCADLLAVSLFIQAVITSFA